MHILPQAILRATKLCLADAFLERIEELRQFLFHRPEQSIAVVSHSGVLEALTGGYLFGNGEIKTLPDFEVSGPAAL